MEYPPFSTNLGSSRHTWALNTLECLGVSGQFVEALRTKAYAKNSDTPNPWNPAKP